MAEEIRSGNGEASEEAPPREWPEEDLGERVRTRVEELDREVRSFVRAHPVVSLAGALALGYAVGRIATRR